MLELFGAGAGRQRPVLRGLAAPAGGRGGNVEGLAMSGDTAGRASGQLSQRATSERSTAWTRLAGGSPACSSPSRHSACSSWVGGRSPPRL